MYAPLALPAELEVLDGIGLIGQSRVDAGVVESPLEQPAGRADKRKSLLVLAIARLFPTNMRGASHVP